MKLFILLFLSLVLLSCTSFKISEKRALEQSIEKFAKKEFGEKYELKSNDKNTHTIILKNYKKLTDLFPSVHFFIVEHKTNTIIFKDQLNAGTVYWNSNYEVVAISRNINTENSNDTKRLMYYYNVRTKQKSLIVE